MPVPSSLHRGPRGSGAGVGSGYHWLIVAHQWVHKLDANTYSTVMEGHKYLVSFKKPDGGKWNTQFRGQKGARANAIKCLHDALARLEAGEGGDLRTPATRRRPRNTAHPLRDQEASVQS